MEEPIRDRRDVSPSLLGKVRSLFGRDEAPEKRSSLSRLERELVAAVADAYFPPDGPIPVSGTEAGLPAYLEAWVGRSDPGQRVLMRLLLAFTELSPLVFGPRRRRFTHLAPEEQLAFLDGAAKSTIYFRRVSFISLRALLTMGYLSNDEVARHMHMKADTDPFGIGRAAGRDAVATVGAA